mgnify:CR=1 FL=1
MNRERSFISNFKLLAEVIIFIIAFLFAYKCIENKYAEAASKNVVNAYTKSRYDVVTGSNMITILVDKKTGETWRNCVCGEKSNVPGCWEKMITLNPESFNKPQGEVKALKKMAKLIKKQEKLQKELDKTKQQAPAQKQEAQQNQNEPIRIGG